MNPKPYLSYGVGVPNTAQVTGYQEMLERREGRRKGGWKMRGREGEREVERKIKGQGKTEPNY